MQITESNGGCNTLNCQNDDPLDPVTVRFAFDVERVVPLALIGTTTQCFLANGRVQHNSGNPLCIQNVDAYSLTKFTPSTAFNIYTTSKTWQPRWRTNYYPAIYPFGTYPNRISPFPAYAGVVNCTGAIPVTVFRVAWLVSSQNGPCYNDARWDGREFCVAHGNPSSNSNYKDIDGNALPNNARWKGTLCPNFSSK